jgi:uncharacterized membrane protein YbhN (UPF0104 family)
MSDNLTQDMSDNLTQTVSSARVDLAGTEAAAVASARYLSTARARKLLSHWLVQLLVKLAISSGLIWLVCRNIDPTGLTQRFEGQSPEWVFAAALATLAQILIAAVRWQVILRALGIQIPSRTVVSVTFVGSFFNTFLLGNGSGDLARAVLAPPNSRGRSAVVHSVLFDRAVTFAGVGLAILPVTTLNIGPLARNLPVLISIGVVSLPFIGLLWLEPVVALLVRWRQPFAGLAQDLVDSWQRLRRSWRHFLLSLAFAALSEVAISVVAYCLARAQNLDVSFVDFLALMPPVVLLGALPISIGGWGVRENVLVLTLAPLGIAAGSALLVGVQIGLLGAVLSLPGAAIWLFGHVLRQKP